MIRAQQLDSEIEVAARGQELARLQAHLSREPPLSLAYLRLFHLDLTLRDTHPPRLPPIEVERDAQADADVAVRPRHILLAPELEHRVRTERSLAQTPPGGIHLRSHGAKLRVVGNSSLNQLIYRQLLRGGRSLSDGLPRAGEEAEE